jgi:cytosine/adenosine deaminase-related metal-dependent hydrolase
MDDSMRTLIHDCEVVVTMDDAGREFAGGSILIEDGSIVWIGAGTPEEELALGAERVDGRGAVALPGLINTHHHLYQTLTRVQAVEHGLFGWLKTLYPIWAGLDEEWVWVAARVGLSELALSGCSTTTDHHYIFPPGRAGLLEAEIRAAREIGLRFHPCRGSMDLGVSRGGLPPDEITQDRDAVLSETEEAVRRHHDPRPGSMLRIAVAPCSPFSVTRELMEASATLARRLGVRLHTHIAETFEEEAYCRETYGRRPLELLDDLGWLGEDVWLAHCVHLSPGDIGAMTSTRSGVAWCPTSNMRIGSGIAPVRALLDAGARVGLGVDGSASNDAGDLLAEARMGMLVQRVGRPTAMSAREALRVATRGGAACLGRDDIGTLEAGKRADIALFDVEGLGFAGAEADLVAALLFCAPRGVRDLFVDGRRVVENARLRGADERSVAAEGRRLGRRIAEGTYRRIAT